MVDRGHMFRRAFSWLPAQFASQSDAPVGAPRQFGSTEHLSTEAIAAYVDGELRMKSYLRAAHHLSLCPQCAAEVDGQTQARTALRDSLPISMPTSLLGLLSQIPESAPDEPLGPQRPSRPGGDVERRSRPGGDMEPGLADQLAEGADRDRRKRR
ncbi:anti-sigma E factor RseA [Mycolicibacterium sphagni]|uniref:anti-sigma E factor RseA n=1 Tax=Mycolicibacterium sphagni TaxID=1786 RepID=UPI0021F3B426|nr:anti-sigma E factor RseA [Mycolicibacterium sphagni]MCV7180269.1 RNA polymerase subunit sigma-70 [Mycolicibacterium sphagni]